MKIIIADDEYFVRVGLVKMLEEVWTEEYSLHEVENGRQVVEKVAELRPDVVFLDIKMPQMNGLEAFEQVYALSPETQWIIISGYADFEYARKALQLGAVDYLLKPVSQENLELMMAEVKQRMLKQAESRSRLFQQQMIAVFNGTRSPDKLMQEQKMSYVPVLFTWEAGSGAELAASQRSEFYAELESELRKFNHQNLYAAMVALPSGTAGVILGIEQERGTVLPWPVQSALRKMNEVLERVEARNLSCYGVAGEMCQGLQQLEEHIAAVQAALPMRVLLPQNQMIRWMELTALHNTLPSEAREWGEAVVKLAAAFRKKDYYRYVMLSQMINSFLEKETPGLSAQAKKHAGTFLVSMLSKDLEKLAMNLSEAGNWKKLLERGEKELLREPESSSDMIERVVDYIEQHYADDIGVAGVAEMLNITPNYLSSLFHKKTGKTFVKYVTHLRIAKAKVLLAGNELQVQEVSAAVGFNSPKHFAKLFKEQSGIYPSEFRIGLRNNYLPE